MRSKAKILIGILVLAIVAFGCQRMERATGATSTNTSTNTMASSKLADTRATMLHLLEEHVYLASSATGAKLGGRPDEVEAAESALHANNHDVGSVLAPALKKTPDEAYEFWHSHVHMLDRYTDAVANKDMAQQEAAVNDLLNYAKSFGTLVNSAIPSLPADAVEGLIKEYITSLKAVIDAQAKKDYSGEYNALRNAAKHMDSIASALAKAVSE